LGLGAKAPRGTVASAGEMLLKERIQKDAAREQKRKRELGGAPKQRGGAAGPHEARGAVGSSPGRPAVGVAAASSHARADARQGQLRESAHSRGGRAGSPHGAGPAESSEEEEGDAEEESRTARFSKKRVVR